MPWGYDIVCGEIWAYGQKLHPALRHLRDLSIAMGMNFRNIMYICDDCRGGHGFGKFTHEHDCQG